METREFRARFDAVVHFTNGGRLVTEGFRVDVPGSDVRAEDVAALFVASLGLLATERVELSNLEILPESHRGTCAGPATGPSPAGTGRRLVELSHVVRDGLVTYPGLPGPEIRDHLTHDETAARYAPGTSFAFHRITMVGNTGTYLDSPFHRHRDGDDLAAVALERLVDLPAVVVDVTARAGREVGVADVAPLDVTDCAVLLHTGDDARFATPDYASDAHFLGEAAARWLVDRGAALVGIDALNIDDTEDATRPAHSVLLAAGIPIVEHLTGLGALPPLGARFTAAPPRIEGFSTFPVRAFALVPERR